MVTTHSVSPASGGATAAQGGKILALGLLTVALGVTALVAAFAATLATVFVFGLLLLVAGIAQLAHAWQARTHEMAWDLLGGVLYTLVGGLLVLDPADGAIGLTLLLALFFILSGAVRLTRASGMRARGPAWNHLVPGALDLVLGLLILFGWPESSAWVLGFFLGLELLVTGVFLMLAGSQVRRLRRAGDRGGVAAAESPR